MPDLAPNEPSPPTVECQDLLDAREPIRQGDVLQWLEPVDPWRRHAIVVTADCDIVHRKHAGSLATVPVLRYDEYLASFVLPPKLRTAASQIRDKARARIRAMQATNRPDRPGEMSDHAIDGWIAASEPDAILRTLRAANEKESDELRALVEWLRELPTLEESMSLRQQLDALAVARMMGGGKKDLASLRATLARENVERVQGLPGDAHFLHSLGGSLTNGYVVYLRRIDNIPEEAVALRHHELGDATKVARRISRLTSPYVFRLTQQLGQVFSAIGLPGSYESSRAQFILDEVSAMGEG